MVEDDLAVAIGGVVRLDVYLGESLFILGLGLEGFLEHRLEDCPEGRVEVLSLSRRPEVVDDVRLRDGDLIRHLDLEVIVVVDCPLKSQRVIASWLRVGV